MLLYETPDHLALGGCLLAWAGKGGGRDVGGGGEIVLLRSSWAVLPALTFAGGERDLGCTMDSMGAWLLESIAPPLCVLVMCRCLCPTDPGGWSMLSFDLRCLSREDM